MKKKTILLLSDHPLSTSGVGTQARWLINGLLATNKYSFRCFGGAVKHDNYENIVVNEDFIIKPTNGFGDPNLLRKTLVQLKPDALMLFTDPRFFTWVWAMSDEIRQICPIAYWHLWDNPPWPEFNRAFYEATDLINCINYPTYEMVKERFPEKTHYVPHAVPQELYTPLSQNEALKFKASMLGQHRANNFTALYVSRNARRKMPGDILTSWKMFIDDLQAKYGHKNATFVMHADPLDPEGANLFNVVDMLGIKDSIVFSKDKIGFTEMRTLYSICDTVVNRSSNEGFGLPTLEAMMCGKPIIAIKTGGLTRQVENHETGEQHGIALEPEVKSLVGNQTVPYIYEDFVSHRTLADSFMKMYEMGPEKRAEIGIKAMEYARNNYRLDDVIKKWDETLEVTINKWEEHRNNDWRHIEL